MPQIPDSTPPATTASIDPSCDSAFEVDMVTRIRLKVGDTSTTQLFRLSRIRSPTTMHLSCSWLTQTILMSPSYPKKVQWRRHNRRRYVHGLTVTNKRRFLVISILLPRPAGYGVASSFIPLGVFDQMVAIGTAYESYVRSTTPRSWSDFDSQELLSTNRQVRRTIQFYHNGNPSASLA